MHTRNAPPQGPGTLFSASNAGAAKALPVGERRPWLDVVSRGLLALSTTRLADWYAFRGVHDWAADFYEGARPAATSRISSSPAVIGSLDD